MDGAEAEFAGTSHLAARQELLALDGFAAAKQGPGLIRLVFRFEQRRALAGTVGKMLVAEGQGGGDFAEIEMIEIGRAGGEAALVDGRVKSFRALQPTMGKLQRPVGRG